MEQYERKPRAGRSNNKRRKKVIKRRRILVIAILTVLVIVLGVIIGKSLSLVKVSVKKEVVVAAVNGKENNINNGTLNENVDNEINMDKEVKEVKDEVDEEHLNNNSNYEATTDELNNEKNDIEVEDKKTSKNVEKSIEIAEGNNKKESTETSDDNSTNSNKETKYVKKFENDKICYLTFDDGPTQNITPQILEILKEYDVKVTFFVIGKLAERNPELIKRANEEGHYIANHTYSHDYGLLYPASNSPKSLLDDLAKCNEVLKKNIGQGSNIMRFPGGSFNKTAYQKGVNNAGYHYVDWNSLNGDAEGHNIPPARLVERLRGTIQNQKHITVLMHDSATKQTTVQALPEIIQLIKSQGYEFKTLDQAFDD